MISKAEEHREITGGYSTPPGYCIEIFSSPLTKKHPQAYYNLCKDTAGDVGEKLRTMRLNLKTIEQKISNIVNVIANAGSAALANQLMLLENEREVLDFQIREEERNAEENRLDILASKCTGCNDCMSVCEDGAILGKPKFIHVIELDDCMQCGKCLNVCDQQAIVTAGLKKPKGPRKPIPVKK